MRHKLLPMMVATAMFAVSSVTALQLTPAQMQRMEELNRRAATQPARASRPPTRPVDKKAEVPVLRKWKAKADAPEVIKHYAEEIDQIRQENLNRLEDDFVKIRRRMTRPSRTDLEKHQGRLRERRAEIANPAFLPLRPLKLGIGTVGRLRPRLDEIEVVQVVNENSIIADLSMTVFDPTGMIIAETKEEITIPRITKTLVWVSGINTTELVDEQVVPYSGALMIRETKHYQSAGGQRTVLHLEAIDLQRYMDWVVE